jgi:hypothetical protein
MALTRNGSNQLSGLSRFHGAVGAYGLRSALDNNGKRKNFDSGAHTVENVTNRAALPSGYRHMVAWKMGTKSGAIASRNDMGVTISAAGAGAMGLGTSGTAGIIFGLSGTGGLISSASGSASVNLAAAGLLFASKAVVGSATVSLTAEGLTIALGHTGGVAGVSLDCDWTPYAVGWVAGTTAEAGLTPTGIANAVWQKVIEQGFTAEQIVRLLAAYAAGEASGLEGANPQFIGLDGTTVRIDGTYAAGTRTIDALNGD